MAQGRSRGQSQLSRVPDHARTRESAGQQAEAEAQASVLATLRLLRPETAVGVAKCRVGGRHDGGYVMLDDLDQIGVAYSLGVGPDVSWDLALAERGALVYQYDHTVAVAPAAHPRFRHIRTGIAHSDTLSPDLRRLDTLIQANGDAQRRDMVLKIDIEGHEWDALDVLDPAVFARFRQIVVEFHGLRLLRAPSFRERAERLFGRLLQTHQPVHVHGNNFAGLQQVAGIEIPDCLELTYANRDRYQFAPSQEVFPGKLDAPNDPACPDLRLGTFGFDNPPPLPVPGRTVTVAKVTTEPDTVRMPDYLAAAARQEMDRLTAQQPVTPPTNTYNISPALLDEAWALAGGASPALASEPVADPWAGFRSNALAWAIRHLRMRMRDPSWRCLESAVTASAVTALTGFLHFHATWRHHPAFDDMVAGVAAEGFSLHALARYAAAHCLAMQHNLISIPGAVPAGGGFEIVTGPADLVPVRVAVLNRFEMPSGRKWDAASLQAAIAERIGAARFDTGQRGLLVLSPGAVPADFDPHVITALRHVLRRQGTRHRGLMAVLPVVLRLLPAQTAQAVRFGYAFHSVGNPAAGS